MCQRQRSILTSLWEKTREAARRGVSTAVVGAYEPAARWPISVAMRCTLLFLYFSRSWPFGSSPSWRSTPPPGSSRSSCVHITRSNFTRATWAGSTYSTLRCACLAIAATTRKFNWSRTRRTKRGRVPRGGGSDPRRLGQRNAHTRTNSWGRDLQRLVLATKL